MDPRLNALLVIIILPFEGFWLWMFKHMLFDDDVPESQRIVWILGLVCFNIIAAEYYYLTVYSKTHQD